MPPLKLRIGIESGPVVAGDIGSYDRKDYTVIGNTVNVASRLESSVAESGQIVVGPTTFELAKDLFEFRKLPAVELKGKRKSIQTFLVTGGVGEEHILVDGETG